TVPHEYRAAVQEGILEWNKAFEKIGYRNAIEVVQQREDEDFDPEDMNYNTFRWITTGTAFAMGPSRANPLTGEILDADIIFDADMIRYWKQEAKMFGQNKWSLDEAPSLIQATRQGRTLSGLPIRQGSMNWDAREGEKGPAAGKDDPRGRLWAIRQGV